MAVEQPDGLDVQKEDMMSALDEYIESMRGKTLEATEVVAAELSDGTYAVKTQIAGEVGYMHVDRRWRGLGKRLTLNDVGIMRAGMDGKVH